MELYSGDFADFFFAIHGHRPFPWQQALADRLAKCDAWPDVLDLPTGVGKTAALDAAVFHLALRADTPGKAALRIAFVVDRRLVVDDAFARAEKIATALCEPPTADADGQDIVEEVARRLRRLAGQDAPPLVAQRLRGGAPLEPDWARTPAQPTILCSTVDQVGSRLLFRGYGVSDRMKPVHAGLLGVDSLILLDEAHLSEPFRQTLDAVRSIGGARVRRVLLSATPGGMAEQRFQLLPADRGHPELKRRIEACKPAKVVCSASVADDFAAVARATMTRLKEHGVSPPAVGIVVNRVALAREVFERLREKPKDDEDSGDGVVLMIGRSRDVDRDRIVEALDPFRTGAKTREAAKPLFVVATQCLEVGVDLDLDGLVTQAAPLDALRQRFGRLNRAGRPVPAEGAVLARSEDIARSADDPVYGDRIRKTWKALQELAEDDRVDFGVETLPRRLAEAGIDPNDLATVRPAAPVVMPAYLDFWSRTSPRPTADPEVALFLHGTERTAAGVSLVWRGDVGGDALKDARRDSLGEAIRLVPPRAAEAVEVPLWAVRAWLRLEEEDLSQISDAPERERGGPGKSGRRQEGRRAFRWAGGDDPRTQVVGPEDLRTGDMLIVPAEYGGCDEFGWAPDSKEPVEDVADDAAKPWRGRRCAVRIARDCVQTDIEWARLSALLADESLDGSDLVERLVEALASTVAADEGEGGGAGPRPRDATNLLMQLRNARGRIDIHFPYGGGRENGAILVAERGIDGRNARESAAPTTEDDNASHTSAEPVSLDAHSRHVDDLAGCFANRLGLRDVADDLRLAAFLHDAGKADPRFQIMLSGGDPWNRADGPPLAKSARPWSPGAWTRAGLPKGWRHEALSVRMAQAHPRFGDARDPALVLWLIGTHHGRGRPLYDFLDPKAKQDLPPCLDVPGWCLEWEQPGPQSLAFDFNGADWPALFEDLKRRYGIWGLAHLEAILRLADHRASEAERERKP